MPPTRVRTRCRDFPLPPYASLTPTPPFSNDYSRLLDCHIRGNRSDKSTRPRGSRRGCGDGGRACTSRALAHTPRKGLRRRGALRRPRACPRRCCRALARRGTLIRGNANTISCAECAAGSPTSARRSHSWAELKRPGAPSRESDGLRVARHWKHCCNASFISTTNSGTGESLDSAAARLELRSSPPSVTQNLQPY
jgi:hypothetical protein